MSSIIYVPKTGSGNSVTQIDGTFSNISGTSLSAINLFTSNETVGNALTVGNLSVTSDTIQGNSLITNSINSMQIRIGNTNKIVVGSTNVTFANKFIFLKVCVRLIVQLDLTH